MNIVFSSDEPFIEDGWAGEALSIGETRLRVVQRTPRCRMIDIDQDGATADGRWLKPLTAERDMFLAVYADVLTPGRVRTGDVLTLS